MIKFDFNKDTKTLMIIRNAHKLFDKQNLQDIKSFSDFISIGEVELIEDGEFVNWVKEITTSNLTIENDNTIINLQKEKETYDYIIETTNEKTSDYSSYKLNGKVERIRVFRIKDFEITKGLKEYNERTINGKLDVTMPIYTKTKWKLSIKKSRFIDTEVNLPWGEEFREKIIQLIKQIERDIKLDDLGL